MSDLSGRRKRPQREAQLCCGGSLERRECDQRHGETEHRLPPWLRKTLDLRRGNEVDHQSKRRLVQRIEPQDADPSDLKQADDRSGRANLDVIVSTEQHGLIVGDQTGAAVDQAKGEIRFPAARRTAEQDSATIDRNRGAMNEQAAGHDPAGSRMQNRAPVTAPSAFLWFSAQIEPRCATTICCEIERPSPEWVPNFSPCGRSV